MIKVQLNDDAQLLCPRCGENYMHQGRVSVFIRPDGEDTPDIATHLGVGEPIAKKNPSPRRDGLAIEFQCEFCDLIPPYGYIVLLIYQHKGQTFVEWQP